MPHYTIDKRSGTSADTYLAVGFAIFLKHLLDAAGKPIDDISIADGGPYWDVTCAAELRDEEIAQIQPFALLRPLVTAKQREILGELTAVGFDYESQIEIRKAYKQQYDTLPASARRPDAYLKDDPALQALRDQVEIPHPDLSLYESFIQMNFEYIGLLNKPIKRWLHLPPEVFHYHIRLILRLFAQHPNPMAESIEEWKALSQTYHLGDDRLTMPQITNAITGIGANNPKADTLSKRNLNGFWLTELLKFVGYFNVALPQTVKKGGDRPKIGRKKDDQKIYVIRPVALRLSTIEKLIRDFRAVLWQSTSVKLDILAALRFTEALIKERRSVLEDLELQKRRHHSIAFTEVVQGLDVTFFKGFEKSVATMNLAFLTLPEWLPFPQTPKDADEVSHMLTEHLRIVESLDESHSGEDRLIQDYRDFLSSRDPALRAFFDFTTAYASHTIRKMSKREPVRRFTIDNLEVIIMANDERRKEAGMLPLKPIVEDKGFQKIAAAIRQSTVNAQLANANNNKTYEVRHGLAEEFRRKSRDDHEFIQAISDFLQRYGQENVRAYERNKKNPDPKYYSRVPVSDSDLACLVELVDLYHAPTIARLLIAVGYSPTEKSKQNQNEPGGSFTEPNAQVAETVEPDVEFPHE